MSFSNSIDPVYKTNVNDLLKNQSDLFLKFNSHGSSVVATNTSLEREIISE